MIIDDHNHADWHGHDFKKFIANMDERGIDKCWILSWECPESEVDPATWYAFSGRRDIGPVPFSYCLAYKQAAPDRFVLGYAPDPRKPGAIENLRAAVAIHGVKVCGELKLRMMLDDWDAVAMYRVCGELGLPVLVHIDYEIESPNNKFPHPNWWYGGGIEALERAVAACPQTNFIGHAPGFWAHISGDEEYKTKSYPDGKVLPGGKLPAMLRKYPNLYCDISAGSGANALSRDPEFTKGFLTEFADRVLYGRDYFDNRHQEVLNSLDLSREILDKIYFRNAQKLISE